MLVRRLITLAAFFVGLIVISASLAPREPIQTVATPSPQARLQGKPTPSVAQRVAAELSGAPEAKPTLVTAKRNSFIAVTVTGDGGYDLISIEEFGILKPLDPKVPSQFEFLADRAGSFTIMLIDANRRIGTLRITP